MLALHTDWGDYFPEHTVCCTNVLLLLSCQDSVVGFYSWLYIYTIVWDWIQAMKLLYCNTSSLSHPHVCFTKESLSSLVCIVLLITFLSQHCFVGVLQYSLHGGWFIKQAVPLLKELICLVFCVAQRALHSACGLTHLFLSSLPFLFLCSLSFSALTLFYSEGFCFHFQSLTFMLSVVFHFQTIAVLALALPLSLCPLFSLPLFSFIWLLACSLHHIMIVFCEQWLDKHTYTLCTQNSCFLWEPVC